MALWQSLRKNQNRRSGTGAGRGAKLRQLRGVSWESCEKNLGANEGKNCRYADYSQRCISETEILALIEERSQARANKNWTASDAIRDGLLAKGITLKDGPHGTEWEVGE